MHAVNAVDEAAKQVAAPADRLKKLLEATDKKACLLEMAGETRGRGRGAEGGQGGGGHVAHARASPPCARSLHSPHACPHPHCHTHARARTAANEIDRPLLDLLEQNIAGAEAAGQAAAAEFMNKVRQAALRYAVTK